MDLNPDGEASIVKRHNYLCQGGIIVMKVLFVSWVTQILLVGTS